MAKSKISKQAQDAVKQGEEIRKSLTGPSAQQQIEEALGLEATTKQQRDARKEAEEATSATKESAPKKVSEKKESKEEKTSTTSTTTKRVEQSEQANVKTEQK